eukprot:c19821_g1_i1.p2 GENE.c19821_g1_i1~~c19821_g1_i1.p2  ORF type:complete len:132 (+),score=11.92 c19821_g1_i1:30-425(+)
MNEEWIGLQARPHPTQQRCEDGIWFGSTARVLRQQDSALPTQLQASARCERGQAAFGLAQPLGLPSTTKATHPDRVERGEGGGSLGCTARLTTKATQPGRFWRGQGGVWSGSTARSSFDNQCHAQPNKLEV